MNRPFFYCAECAKKGKEQQYIMVKNRDGYKEICPKCGAQGQIAKEVIRQLLKMQREGALKNV